MPSWLSTVIESSSTRNKDSKLTLISIETFQTIIESKSEDPNLKSLKILVQPASRQQNLRNYCMGIIKTLWSLLDEPADHEKIV